jgi:hypothetical protein
MWEPETHKKIERGAKLSDDKAYRYLLWRVWDRGLPLLGFVLLNPSVADATQDDPTIEWCCKFADQHDFGGIMVANLCAFRVTDPGRLRTLSESEAIGPDNERSIYSMAEQCATVIVGWGNHGAGYPAAKLQAVASLSVAGDHVFCLGLTAQREPIHPMFFARGSGAPQLARWKWGG